MATKKAKTVLSWIIAVVIAYFVIKLLFYSLGVAFFLAFTFIKFIIVIVLLAIIAVPLYAIIRRKFIK
ncbi:MAG: hypothetical protein WCR42_05580 [bacterium]